MSTYRLCVSLTQLRTEVNRAYPHRDTSSDGWIGDTRHQASKSDHNPNQYGVVRAIDIDTDGIPAAQLAVHIRALGASGDRRLRGGYVIYNRRIASTMSGWNWHQYTGTDPHTGHIHVSAALSSGDYDVRGGWGIVPVQRDDSPRLGLFNPPLTGQSVLNVQRFLNTLGNRIPEDGVYGRKTADVVNIYKLHRGIHEAGWDDKCWAYARKEIRERAR